MRSPTPMIAPATAKRWNIFLGKKGKELKKSPSSIEAVVTVKSERCTFKKLVRRVVQYTPDDLTTNCFSASMCPEVHRLQALNVIGHEACCKIGWSWWFRQMAKQCVERTETMPART